MIIANGYIRIIAETGGGYDSDGNPIEVTESLGEPILCNWERNSYQKRGTYADGVFTTASYVVRIEQQEFEPCRFALYDFQNQLGEFEVHQGGIVDLSAVGAIQLTV